MDDKYLRKNISIWEKIVHTGATQSQNHFEVIWNPSILTIFLNYKTYPNFPLPLK